ncbi:MAG: hypothetical protein ACI35Q_00650 [Marinilabiliaceae bacterium]
MKLLRSLVFSTAVASVALLTSCDDSKPLEASLEYTFFGLMHTTGDFNVTGKVKSIVDSVYCCEVKFGEAQKGGLLEITKFKFNSDNQLEEQQHIYEDERRTLSFDYKNGILSSYEISTGAFAPNAQGDAGSEAYSFEMIGDTITCDETGDYVVTEGGKVKECVLVKPIFGGEVAEKFRVEYNRDGMTMRLASVCSFNYKNGRDESRGAKRGEDVIVCNKYGKPVSRKSKIDELGNYNYKYDENGDVVSQSAKEIVNIFLKDSSKQYEYKKYDSHNNWVECFITEHSREYHGYKLVRRTIEYR